MILRDDGRTATKSVIDGWLFKAQRAAGLAKKGPHILRHTFCSRLALRGATPKAIKELAGHVHSSTTDRYMHLAPSALKTAIDLLDAPGASATASNNTSPAVVATSPKPTPAATAITTPVVSHPATPRDSRRPMARLKALESLLLKMFSAEELRRLVRYLPEGDTLSGALPGLHASPVMVAEAVVGVLDRDGALNEATVWDRLYEERVRAMFSPEPGIRGGTHGSR